MRALDKGSQPKQEVIMKVIILISAFASAGAFIGRIVKENMEV